MLAAYAKSRDVNPLLIESKRLYGDVLPRMVVRAFKKTGQYDLDQIDITRHKQKRAEADPLLWLDLWQIRWLAPTHEEFQELARTP
jgi:hypothetical protein